LQLFISFIFPITFQIAEMLDLLKALLIIALLFAGYQLALKHTGFLEVREENSTSIYAPPPIIEEKFEPVPVPVPVEERETPKPVPVEKPVAPAGPNPPAQQGPPGVRHIIGGEQPVDPYAEMQEDAYAPEKLRNPERMFRPAPENDNVSMAAMGGLASAQNAVPQHVGAFAPEMAQNGGYFMDGIAANDLDAPTSYSEY
jgi:hypothetical protein